MKDKDEDKLIRPWVHILQDFRRFGPEFMAAYRGDILRRPTTIAELLKLKSRTVLMKCFAELRERTKELGMSDDQSKSVASTASIFDAQCFVTSVFHSFGRNVFRMGSSMIQMFLETELSFPIEYVHFPFPCFYIELPEDSGVHDPDGDPIVGFFVFSMPYTAEDMNLQGDVVVLGDVPLRKDEFLAHIRKLGLPEEETLKQLREEGSIVELPRIEKSGRTFTLLAASKDLSYIHFTAHISNDDTRTAEEAALEIPEAVRKRNAYRRTFIPGLPSVDAMCPMQAQMVRIAFNLALYMSQKETATERLDLEKTVEPRLRELHEACGRRPASQLQELYDRVLNEGASTIINVGQRLEVKIRAARAALQTDPNRTVTCHWRRGHWHHFWVGKHGSPERKLIPKWLQPVPVAGKDPEIGHQYQVGTGRISA